MEPKDSTSINDLKAAGYRSIKNCTQSSINIKSKEDEYFEKYLSFDYIPTRKDSLYHTVTYNKKVANLREQHKRLLKILK
ncbi:hypothetical protein [Desulfonatronum parangueonense]